MKVLKVEKDGGYVLSRNYCSVSGDYGVTVSLDQEETAEEARKRAKIMVREWLAEDLEEAREDLRRLLEIRQRAIDRLDDESESSREQSREGFHPQRSRRSRSVRDRNQE